MKRILIFGFCAFVMSWSSQAQDNIYSQFYAAPLQMSPAFAGTTIAPRLAANYRTQWVNWAGGAAYNTYSVSYEQYVESLNSGFGVMIEQDDQGQGLLTGTNFAAIYSYNVRVNDNFGIKIGAEAGFSQNRYNWDAFVFRDQIDRIEGFTDPSGNPFATEEIRPEDLNATYFDAGAGSLFYGPMFYGGLSLKHLTTPDETILDVNDNITGGRPMRISVHGGAQFDLDPRNNLRWEAFLSPNFTYIQQADFRQVNAGAYLRYGAIFGGAWYRHAFGNQDALIGLVGYQYDLFKIGYSYDYTVSGAPSGGTHEISVVLNFDNSAAVKTQRRNSRYNDCFKLFR